MQPGQFLVHKDGRQREIQAVSGKAIAFEVHPAYESKQLMWRTLEQLENDGWSLLEEPWVPKNEDWVWVVFCGGGIGERHWASFDEEEKNFVLNIGNYARTEAEAKLHRQKLIERMEKKNDYAITKEFN